MEETEGIDERRVRRAKRREKQRLANHDRALTMRKARLQAEKEGLVPASEKLNKTVYIGCSGWFYWHWRGGFYPEESSTSFIFRAHVLSSSML